jgi:Ca2+-binding EF-hand superfamily protein
MFLSEESLFSQTQKVLMQGLEPGGSGRPLRASMLFNLCDLNHDEKVEFKEVIMLLAACSDATGAERLELAFSVLDADHSGNLSYKEVLILQQWNFMFLFRVALQYILLKASNDPEIPNLEDQVEGWWKELLLQKQYPNDIAHVIMDLADKDQNGSISRAEYSAFMRDPGSQEVILGTVRSYLVEIKQVFDFRLETLQNRD